MIFFCKNTMKTVLCIARRLKSSLQKLYGHHYGFPLRLEALPFYVHFFIPLSPTILLQDLIIWITWWVSYKKQEMPTLREHPCWSFCFHFSVWCFLFFVFFFICLCSVSCAECCQCISELSIRNFLFWIL